MIMKLKILILPDWFPKSPELDVVICPKDIVCWLFCCCGWPKRLVEVVGDPKPKEAGFTLCPNVELAALLPKRFVLAFCCVNNAVFAFVLLKPEIKND